MTMLALAFSCDYCIIAADRAVGTIGPSGKEAPTPDSAKTTKLKWFNNSEMPFVVTASGFANAVEVVPHLLKVKPISQPEHICLVAHELAKLMKNELDENTWSQTHTTSCWLALTVEGDFFTHAFYLNDETTLFTGLEPKISVIPAGFCDPQFAERKKAWEQKITQSIQPENADITPQRRLEMTLLTFVGAFKDCASINNFVSEEFDYCVISKEQRKIYFNELPK